MENVRVNKVRFQITVQSEQSLYSTKFYTLLFFEVTFIYNSTKSNYLEFNELIADSAFDLKYMYHLVEISSSFFLLKCT